TDFDLSECTLLDADEFGARWACAGYKGYPVWIAEGDLRFFVSYGFYAPEQPAAGQTPGPFNTLGPRIEWRMTDEDGNWRPIATIVRYLTEPPDYRGEMLVVTRLGPEGVCQVAWIDARANPDANELAREAADTLAPDFDCAQQPVIWGMRGQSF
ncbi:MAG TPA: hypothetical protein VMW31_02580, partial [Devosiaceae bacterium]|nr:hypothetical protein [Devosiaceae bacterium]